MTLPRAWVSWSSGKDCALALHIARAASKVEVVGLLTTVNEVANRVSMHGVRRSLVAAQAQALGLPLMAVALPQPCDNETYEQRMAEAIGHAAVSALAPPHARRRGRVSASGIRAVITCVDPAKVPAALAGRSYDADLLADLPAGVDPCAENGEFHTFVVDGPDFAHWLDIRISATIERVGLVFADVIPAG